MSNILFVTTQYRVGERIYPIIPKLSEKYNLDLMKLYQMDPSWAWPGDVDLRNNFDQKYLQYFDNIYNNINIDYGKYDLIITDDNRTYNGLSEIYQQRKCLLLACSHGISEHGYEIHNVGKSYDGCFVFGRKEVKYDHQIPAGIPANDKLKHYKNVEKKHILVIISYLGYEGSPQTGNSLSGRFIDTHFKSFDKDVFDIIDLLHLQNKYKKPVVIKLKSRPTSNIKKDNEYLKEVLPKQLQYSVIHDVYDDNKLIGESEIVVGCPSTLALKSIQLQIPTALIVYTGQVGLLKDYPGICNYNTKDIHRSLETVPSKTYIDDILQGGTTFNSTEYYMEYIKQCIQ